MNKPFKYWIILSIILAVLVTACTPAGTTPTTVGQPSATQIELAPTAPPATQPSPTLVVVTPTVGQPAGALQPTPGSAFCANPEVQNLLTSLAAALKNADGKALAGLVDPVNGLDIFYRLANPAVHIASDEIAGLFASTFSYTWGDQAGSGLPVEGTFRTEILPLLLNVTDKTYTQSCQDLTRGMGTGPTTAMVEWPKVFDGMPFIALFRAPGPTENEMDWRTWAVGFTVVNGQPKIRVLVQYFWEI